MKKLIKKKSKVTFTYPRIEYIEIPFFLSYFVFLVYSILSVSFYRIYVDAYWKLIFIFCIFLLALYELIKNGLNFKNLLAIGLILLFFVNVTRIGQGMVQNSVAAIMFYMFCARDISFKKIATYTIMISGIMLFFIICSAYIGIIPNYIDEGTRHREYLGFLYALYAPTLMSNISLLWLYNHRNSQKIKKTLLFCGINLFFYIKTNSRMCFILTVFALFFGFFLKKYGYFILRRKIICYIMIISFIICACISYGLSIEYDSSVAWMASLNSILGGRLYLGNSSLQKYGISPLGIDGIKWIGNGLDMYGEKSKEEYIYVDSFYVQFIQRFGYVLLVIVLLVLTYACYQAYIKKDIYLMCIFVILAAHFMIDELYLYLQYNTFWLAVGTLIFSKRDKSRRKIHSDAGRRLKVLSCLEEKDFG